MMRRNTFAVVIISFAASGALAQEPQQDSTNLCQGPIESVVKCLRNQLVDTIGVVAKLRADVTAIQRENQKQGEDIKTLTAAVATLKEGNVALGNQIADLRQYTDPQNSRRPILHEGTVVTIQQGSWGGGPWCLYTLGPKIKKDGSFFDPEQGVNQHTVPNRLPGAIGAGTVGTIPTFGIIQCGNLGKNITYGGAAEINFVLNHEQ